MAETENKELASRLETLESSARMLELKHKNSLEHSSRLEEREADLKKVLYQNLDHPGQYLFLLLIILGICKIT